MSLRIAGWRDESATREVFEAFVRNVSAADPRQMDDLFARLLPTRMETDITYPDDPARRHVNTYGYRADADLPLRLAELDARERSAAPPAHSQGVGSAARTFGEGPWRFSFELPTRETDVAVGNVTVDIRTDRAGAGMATAHGLADGAQGLAIIRAAFGKLGVAPPDVDPGRVHAQPRPCPS